MVSDNVGKCGRGDFIFRVELRFAIGSEQSGLKIFGDFRFKCTRKSIKFQEKRGKLSTFYLRLKSCFPNATIFRKFQATGKNEAAYKIYIYQPCPLFFFHIFP